MQRSFVAQLQRGDGAPPVALLWTDADGQWREMIRSLRAAIPTLFQLGAYNPEERTGPAIWLRCIVDRTLREAPAAGETPILYLPKVSRQLLRSPEDCPTHLQPLIELQYRGEIWRHANGNDWTVRAFLVSNEGVGLDVAGDRRTEEALLQVLDALAEYDLDPLRGRRLDSDDFYKIRIEDPVRDALRWIDDPKRVETAWRGSKWESFRGICRHEFAFDPDRVPSGEIAAQLVKAEPRVERLWQRFAEAPQLYRGVARAMRDGAPAPASLLHPERNPVQNDGDEQRLRTGLESCAKLPHSEACARVLELEREHGPRRDWVWAATDLSPWAMVLKPLAKLAELASKPISVSSLTSMANTHTETGWQCDAAALEALASRLPVVAGVVRAMYLPWLDTLARGFQKLASTGLSVAPKQASLPADTCILFVDGLRYDIGMQLADRLRDKGLQVRTGHRLAPAPTVTATAKPAAAPGFYAVAGGSAEDFTPTIESKGTKRALTTDVFRSALGERGVAVFSGSETVSPASANAVGWTECGAIDRRGHDGPEELPRQIAGQLDGIVERVDALLGCGWKQVRVVTDHGWLLMPGGLPKVDLPHYFAETKWARCAVVKGEPDISFPVVPWYWNAAIRIASPPGAAAFRAGEMYAHGGLSLQECVVPEISVEKGSNAVEAAISAILWHGMRCRVRVDTTASGLKVDIRTAYKQPDTSIAQSTKEVGPAGEASVVVADDSNEGKAAFVVVLDNEGNVVTSKTTSVGENA
jgi:hypothetical protein